MCFPKCKTLKLAHRGNKDRQLFWHPCCHSNGLSLCPHDLTTCALLESVFFYSLIQLLFCECVEDHDNSDLSLAFYIINWPHQVICTSINC